MGDIQKSKLDLFLETSDKKYYFEHMAEQYIQSHWIIDHLSEDDSKKEDVKNAQQAILMLANLWWGDTDLDFSLACFRTLVGMRLLIDLALFTGNDPCAESPYETMKAPHMKKWVTTFAKEILIDPVEFEKSIKAAKKQNSEQQKTKIANEPQNIPQNNQHGIMSFMYCSLADCCNWFSQFLGNGQIQEERQQNHQARGETLRMK